MTVDLKVVVEKLNKLLDLDTENFREIMSDQFYANEELFKELGGKEVDPPYHHDPYATLELILNYLFDNRIEVDVLEETGSITGFRVKE